MSDVSFHFVEVGLAMACVPPGKTFFLQMFDGRLDSLVDLDSTGLLPFDTLDEAVAQATADAIGPSDRIGSYIFEVRPVRYIPKARLKAGEHEQFEEA